MIEMAYSIKTRLLNKVAVITGSSYGIGYSIARRLAQEGAKIVISSRNQENVTEAVDKLKADSFDVLGLVCHVSHEQDRKKLYEKTIEEFGGIDILICNAAVNPAIKPILLTEESEWDKIFNVNVKSPFLMTKEVIPYMRKQGKGSIIYISSVTGYDPINNIGAYCVSKTALFGLTKTCALNCASDNIRVNCVAPGLIDTTFSKILSTSTDDSVQVKVENITLGRIGNVDEVSGAVAFLASDDASYITGETICVAGGSSSRL